jgi:hypothetical protein
LKKPSFPTCQRRTLVIEDEIIPLFSDEACPNQKELHKERVWALLPCLGHHLVEIHGQVLVDLKMVPALLAETTGEK